MTHIQTYLITVRYNLSAYLVLFEDVKSLLVCNLDLGLKPCLLLTYIVVKTGRTGDVSPNSLVGA